MAIVTLIVSLWYKRPYYDDDHCNVDEKEPIIYWDPEQKPGAYELGRT